MYNEKTLFLVLELARDYIHLGVGGGGDLIGSGLLASFTVDTTGVTRAHESVAAHQFQGQIHNSILYK